MPDLTLGQVSLHAKRLRTITQRLEAPLKLSVARQVTARVFGYDNDHAMTRTLARHSGSFAPDHTLGHEARRERHARQEVAIAEFVSRHDVSRNLLARVIRRAWCPTADIGEALKRDANGPLMMSLRMSDIATTQAGRWDVSFYAFARHLAEGEGVDWEDPEARRRMIARAESLENAGVSLERPWPDQKYERMFADAAERELYLVAAGFERSGEEWQRPIPRCRGATLVARPTSGAGLHYRVTPPTRR